MLTHPHILPASALKPVVAQLKAAGKRIVWTGGVFDILHPGHVDLLTKAKALGDVLIVAINPDDSVKRIKGPERPFNSQDTRAYMLANIKAVDYVTFYPDGIDSGESLVAEFQPPIVVKSAEYVDGNSKSALAVKAYGGQFVGIPPLAGFSTSKLATLVRERTHLARADNGGE